MRKNLLQLIQNFFLVLPLKDLHLFWAVVFLEVQAKSLRVHLPEPRKETDETTSKICSC